ncbi:MAG: gliding motility lipoprotein GldH [Sphingobacteriales bacterium]|nr:MAG: gliding motility lipoprotein GldH [Sphingobacteriales bacterium]
MFCNTMTSRINFMTPRFFKQALFLSAITGLVFFISSCRPVNVYEKNVQIPGLKWSSAFGASGSFEISDTLSSYNIYIVLRHTDAYKYNNIWLNVGLQSPGDSLYFQKVDLSLGSDAAGWEGTGMNDIWEVRKPLALNKRFKKNGAYQFNIFHIMRDNPLTDIMSAGLRVEKAQ